MSGENTGKASTSKRLGGDFLSAAISGLAVSPVISAVDRALAENASGKAQLWPSFFQSFREMAAAPIKFVKSPQFGWIWLVYSSTYAGVNACQTVCDVTNTDPAFPKWATSFVVNTSTCIAKDRAFARLFGTKAAGATPMMSYMSWFARDIISMGVFFTLPPIVGKQIANIVGDEDKGYYIAQIVLPLAVQFITTPVHLVGYDFYNNPNNTVKQRFEFMGKDYFKNVSIRMVRMAPPWSFGTILNKELRAKFHQC